MADETIPKLLERLKGLEKAATPGPWTDGTYTLKDGGTECVIMSIDAAHEEPRANLSLCCESRNALPLLLKLAALAVQARHFMPMIASDVEAVYAEKDWLARYGALTALENAKP